MTTATDTSLRLEVLSALIERPAALPSDVLDAVTPQGSDPDRSLDVLRELHACEADRLIRRSHAATGAPRLFLTPAGLKSVEQSQR